MAVAPRPNGLRSFLRRHFGAARHDEGGAVAIIFALGFFVLIGLAGGAVDAARVYTAASQVQNAMDAAALAAARMKQLGATDAEALAAGDVYFAAVRQSLNMRGPINLEVADAGATIRGVADLQLRTTFLGALGIESLSVKGASVATFGAVLGDSTNVELSMMLDTTGSMRGRKLAELKDAAEDLVNILLANSQRQASVRVALVPFSNAVKLDPSLFRAASGADIGSGSGCVVEREGTEAYTDAAPAAGKFVLRMEARTSRSCESDREIVPLTSDAHQLKVAIRAFTDGGTTAGHLGTAWAWYTLSQQWGGVFTGASQPGPYSDLSVRLSNGAPKLRKIAVLMTDGEYNTSYSGTSSTTQARNLCAAMRATGIEVFTVGFALGNNATAVDTLRRCASAPTNFYNTTTGDELKLAFRDIGLKTSPLRLAK